MPHSDFRLNRNIIYVVLIVGLVSAIVIFGFGQLSSAVSSTFNQTDWSGGTVGLPYPYPMHGRDGTGWRWLESKDSNVVISGAGQLTLQSAAQVPAASATLPSARAGAPATYDSATNQAYVFGGYRLNASSNDPEYLTEIAQYNVAADTATATGIGVLPVGLYGSAAVQRNSTEIYIFGGATSTGFSNKVYKFNPAAPASNAVDTGYTLPQAAVDVAAAYDSTTDKFYIFGGFYLDGSNDPQYLNTVVQFDPATGATTTTGMATLPATRRGLSAVAVSSSAIYLFGGSNGSGFATTIYKFNPASPASALTTVANLPWGGGYMQEVYNPAAGVVNKIYLFGGIRNNATTQDAEYRNEIITFKPADNTVATQTIVLPYQLSRAAAVYSYSNESIYVLGGYNNTGAAFSSGVLKYGFSSILTATPFNLTDATTPPVNLQWTENLFAETEVRFQVRTATNNNNSTPADNTDDTPQTWTNWCGYNDGSSCNSNIWFTDPTGLELMPSLVSDGTSDHWFQYRVQLISADLSVTPTLSDFNLAYAINTEPTVTLNSAAQDEYGVVNVNYDSADAEETVLNVSLLYDVGATLSSELSLTGMNVNVTGIDASYIASSGTIQVDSEQMTYTGKSGSGSSFSLTGVTRGVSTGYYQIIHTQGSPVWFKASTVSGTVGNNVSKGNGKTIAWTAKTDLPELYLANTVKVRVNLSDGNVARQVAHASTAAFDFFDTKNPVTSTTGHSSDIGFTLLDAASTQSITAGMLTNSGLTGYTTGGAQVVDGSIITKAWDTDSASSNSTLAVNLGTGNALDYVRVRMYLDGANYTGTYDVDYSDNGTTWTRALAGFAPNASGWNEKSWTNAGVHQYWRVKLTNTPGAGPDIMEFELNISATADADIKFQNTNAQSVQANLAVTDDTQIKLYAQDITGGASFNPPASITNAAWLVVTQPFEVKQLASLLTAGEAPKTVQARLRDTKGNVADKTYQITLDLSAPSVPTGMAIKENSSPSDSRLFISWAAISDPGDFLQYAIERSAAGGAYSSLPCPQGSLSSTAKNFCTDDTVDNGVIYAYRVASEDVINNKSATSQSVTLTAGGPPVDTSPVTVSNG